MPTLMTTDPRYACLFTRLPDSPGLATAAADYEQACHFLNETLRREFILGAELDEINAHLPRAPRDAVPDLRNRRAAIQEEQRNLPADLAAARQQYTTSFVTWARITLRLAQQEVTTSWSALSDTNVEWTRLKQRVAYQAPTRGARAGRQRSPEARRLDELRRIREPLQRQHGAMKQLRDLVYRAMVKATQGPAPVPYFLRKIRVTMGEPETTAGTPGKMIRMPTKAEFFGGGSLTEPTRV